jgi:hypothetical protein
MGNDERDINKNFTNILFVIFFSIFAFTFSGKSNSQALNSLSNSVQNELVIGYNSSHEDAIIFGSVHLPVSLKSFGYTFSNSSLNLFNLQYKISGYNRRIVQNIILIQKTRLSIDPVDVWSFCFHLNQSEKEDMPVLS